MAQTRGFQVSVIPQAPSVDPRLLAFSPQVITQGLEQGARAYGNLMQIQQAREEAPIRRQMLQLQQDNAMLNNARLSQPISQIIGTEIEERPRFPEQIGIREDGTTFTERPAGYDVFQVDTIQEIDPRTGQIATRKAPSKIINTLEGIEKDQAQADYRGEIAGVRAQEAETRRLASEAKIENDRLRTQVAQEKEIRLNSNPMLRSRTVERDGRVFYEYFNINNPAVVVDVVDKGPVRENGIGALLGVLSYGTQVPQQPVQQPQVSQNQQEDISPEVASLINRLGGGSATPAPAVSAGSTPEFANSADAEAAGASGQLGNKRVRIKIGNRYAWWEPES